MDKYSLNIFFSEEDGGKETAKPIPPPRYRPVICQVGR
jgi:hypothetical protein